MPLTKITLLAIAAALTAVANDLEAESETNGEPAAPITPKPRGRPRGSAATPPAEPTPLAEPLPIGILGLGDPKDHSPAVTVEQLKAAGDPLVKANKGKLIKDLFKIHGGGSSYSTTPDENKPALLAAIEALAEDNSFD